MKLSEIIGKDVCVATPTKEEYKEVMSVLLSSCVIHPQLSVYLASFKRYKGFSVLGVNANNQIINGNLNEALKRKWIVVTASTFIASNPLP